MDPLKKRVFYYHLIVSLCIIVSISATCLFIWFPQPYLFLDGTWAALLTLACIDIIIGPLLTLLLVNSKKSVRELTTDMVIIVIIQVTALSYGLVQIEKERLIALVHYDGVFHLVPKKVLIEPINQGKSIPLTHQYLGTPLVTINKQTATIYSQQSQNNSLPFLYALINYKPMDEGVVLNNNFAYTNLPSSISQMYSQDYTFKVLVGKQRTAVIVFSTNMSIVDIQLLPQTD